MSPTELIARFSAEDPQWRREAVAQLVAAGPRVVPWLLEAAEDPAIAVRVHAIEALGKLHEGLAVVLSALGETASNGAVAIAAERALIEWPSSAPSVEHVALFGAPTARARAVRVLKNYRGPELPALMKRLLGDALDTVRLQAAEALAAMDPQLARSELPALLDDQTDYVRWGVAEALVKIDCPLGEVVLAEALRHDDTHEWAEALLEELAEGRRQGRTKA